MKPSSAVEKWVALVLGVVCVVVVGRLVFGIGAGQGTLRPATTGRPATASSAKVPAHSAEEIARYDPVVRLDLLKEFADRPLPKIERNPFEFEAAPVVPVKGAVPGPGTPGPTTPPQPPPPPPIPLKAIGYADQRGGGREAYVADDAQVYVVHEGDTINRQYRVVKITPSTVTVEDVSSHQSAELPVPQ